MAKRLRLGVDELGKAARLENLRVTPEGFLRKRGGTRLVHSFNAKIRGALSAVIGGNERIFLVAGTALYSIDPELLNSSDESADSSISDSIISSSAADFSSGDGVALCNLTNKSDTASNSVEDDSGSTNDAAEASTPNLYISTISSDNSSSISALGTIAGSFSDGDLVDMYMFAGKLYILGGGELSRFDGSSVEKVDGYVPLITRNSTYNTVGTPYERRNLISPRVRITMKTEQNVKNYWLGKNVVSVEKVFHNGVQMSTSSYTVNSNGTETCVSFLAAFSEIADEALEVWFTLSSSGREKVLSCRHSAVYGGDTDSRVFLYGGSDRAVVYPSEPADALSGGKISGEYFPEGAEMTVADGNPAVSGAVRQFDRLAIFTEEGAFYTYPREAGTVNGIPRFEFPILPLNSDVGATKTGGAVLLENEPYALNRHGLYRFKSTSVRDERLAVRIEVPESVGLTRTFIDSCSMYVDRLRGELWCFANDLVIIYNARQKCWYKFTGITADGIFECGVNCYFHQNDLYVTDDTIYTDRGETFAAVCEFPPLDFGDPFERKTLGLAGAVIGRDAGASLNIQLETDSGGKVILPFAIASDSSNSSGASDSNGSSVLTNSGDSSISTNSLNSSSSSNSTSSDSSESTTSDSSDVSLAPVVFLQHAKLGRFEHLRLTISSKNSAPLTLREVALTLLDR